MTDGQAAMRVVGDRQTPATADSPVYAAERTALSPERLLLTALEAGDLTLERQMMAYFPNLRLLYGSDPFQRRANGVFATAQTVSELASAVEREGLAVDAFFMMHMGLTDWRQIDAALEAAKEAGSAQAEF